MIKFLKSFSKKKVLNSHLYFEIFEKIYISSPAAFFWIKPFPARKGRYILSYFKQDFFTKYNGLEIVIFDRQLMTYYRLPGAKPDGHGQVSIGNHYISINCMNDKEKTYFLIEKINPLDIEVRHIYFQPESISYTHLETRTISYDLFIPELTEIILSGLEWYYRSRKILNASYKEPWSNILEIIIDNNIDNRIKLFANRIRLTD